MNLTCHECNGDECTVKTLYKCSEAFACFSVKSSSNYYVNSLKKGCLYDLDNVRLFCNLTKPKAPFPMRCCSSNLCNNDSFVPNILPSLSDSQINLSQILALILLLGLCLVLLSSTTFYIVKKFRKSALQNNNKPTFDPEASIDYDIVNRLKMINNPNEPNEISITSGTGSGMPLFIKRTFCRDIVLKESIYKGKKIEVWRGLWLDRNIAVKIFSSRDEDIWTRERDMYIKVSNMSPFILSLLGADLTSNNSCTEYWLITEYCQIGSLYDFLNVQTLTYAQCYSLLRSIISGIKTLHYEFPSYSIAHRDLKSKNILLHTPWQACIADFGLAVSTEDSGDMYCEPQKFKVGTKRYMAPEILDETFDYRYFESFQLVDMYCFSLVMWEILTRCKLDGNTTVEEYCLPYGKVVPSDPSFGDMKKVVCEDNQRPFISEALKNDKMISPFLDVMTDCWQQNPTERSNAMSVWTKMEENLSEKLNILGVDCNLAIFYN